MNRYRREPRKRSPIFRTMQIIITREGPDAVHMNIVTTVTKVLTFSMTRDAAKEVAGGLIAAAQGGAQ